MNEHTMKMALAVVDAAREAMKNSFEAGNDDMDIAVPSHLAAALSLRLDEYDAARAEQPAQPLNRVDVACDIKTLCVNGDLPDAFQAVADWVAAGEVPAQQEPLGYISALEWKSRQSELVVKITRNAQPQYGFTHALYTSPPQRQQLTTQEIREWWASENGLEDCKMSRLHDFEKVVRAVEARLGITKGGAQ